MEAMGYEITWNQCHFPPRTKLFLAPNSATPTWSESWELPNIIVTDLRKLQTDNTKYVCVCQQCVSGGWFSFLEIQLNVWNYVFSPCFFFISITHINKKGLNLAGFEKASSSKFFVKPMLSSCMISNRFSQVLSKSWYESLSALNAIR